MQLRDEEARAKTQAQTPAQAQAQGESSGLAWEQTAAAGASDLAPPPGAGAGPAGGSPIRRGTRLGRFTVLEKLGEGGMGVVVSAYDPELDRRVAIKLLQQRYHSQGSEGPARLKREAQAMARLRHPNVLSVFEVGEEKGQLFMAMEYVRGGTLAQRLEALAARNGKGWREILELFVAAGRGLEAAHQAGLVHRDFKPANVLCGEDGGVQVTDFGLVGTDRGARGEAPPPQPVVPELSPELSGNMLSSDLTMPGEIMGTPLYMAPEQHRGANADARSDQYSFCLALYEALYGELPFSSESPEEYIKGKLDGTLAPIPAAGVSIPPWLRAALLRGLALDPARRHPSMTVLLAEIGFDPVSDQEVGRAARYSLAGALGLAWLVPPLIAYLYQQHAGALSWTMLLALDSWVVVSTTALLWRQRAAILRTQFDRRLAGLVVLSIASQSTLLCGAWLIGMEARTALTFHLLVWAVLVSAFAVIADRRFLMTAAFMAVTFLASSAWPEGVFLMVEVATLSLIGTGMLIWRKPVADQ